MEVIRRQIVTKSQRREGGTPGDELSCELQARPPQLARCTRRPLRMQTQPSDGRQIDASFNPEEGDQTPAAVFRYSAIGPRARTGRKDRAPMSKTVPNTRIPKVMVSLGSVPMVSAFRPWRAKRPASSSARAASTNRPAIMARIVVML